MGIHHTQMWGRCWWILDMGAGQSEEFWKAIVLLYIMFSSRFISIHLSFCSSKFQLMARFQAWESQEESFHHLSRTGMICESNSKILDLRLSTKDGFPQDITLRCAVGYEASFCVKYDRVYGTIMACTQDIQFHERRNRQVVRSTILSTYGRLKVLFLRDFTEI